MKSVITSPFKFLDSYTVDDRAFFFGREKEIDKLYNMVFSTNLLLIYGPSGAGKTSLIQCGLASRFEDTDWHDIHVRWRGDINVSMKQVLKKHAIAELSEEATAVEMIQSIYLDHFKPLFLVFDQFEELYILGSEPERELFIDTISKLLELDIPLKIIFSMREEYIARLYDFEQKVPNLFKNRFRIDPMDQETVASVIRGLADHFDITLENEEVTIEKIIDNISSSGHIQLSYLQVYLDYLYVERQKISTTDG
ncbi:MAG: hypothetical protein AB8F74_17640 [Saprospiraceae bacterium]